jgi:hypothetical protein
MEVTYLGNAGDHVVDERANGSDSASLLVRAKPHAEPDEVAGSLFGGLLEDLQLNANVGEVLGNRASSALYRHDS